VKEVLLWAGIFWAAVSVIALLVLVGLSVAAIWS
jgi:hypothetical protein